MARLVSDDARAYLEEIDYDRYFSLIVFNGRKPTLGYEILVSLIYRENDSVYIDAQTIEPGPDSVQSDLESSPYHLVVVEKVGDWGRTVTFNLIVDGDVVAAIDEFIR